MLGYLLLGLKPFFHYLVIPQWSFPGLSDGQFPQE